MGGAHGRKGDVGGCDEVGTVAEIIPVVWRGREEGQGVSSRRRAEVEASWLVGKSAYEKCAKEPSYVI